MAIIIHQDATEFSLFKSVNCSTCFGWYFTHHQELITLYLQNLTLRPLLLPVVSVTRWELATAAIGALANGYHPWSSHLVTLTTGSSNGLSNARHCRYSDVSS